MASTDLLIELSKNYQRRFKQQHQYIKALLAGTIKQCSTCQQQVTLTKDDVNGTIYLHCQKGCTDILLDL